jgi:hypothetical protein
MRAEPHDLARLLLQSLCDRERRVDVTTGAACHDKNWT